MGTFVIISAPSGGGKNTVIAELLRRIPSAARFVTTTTRPPRPGEEDGVDYHFLDDAAFYEKKQRGDFLECNFYNGHWYCTDRHLLEQVLQRHDIVFGAIDVHGKEAIDASDIPHFSVFLLPDSMATLEKRIRRRGGLADAQVEERLQTAKEEMAKADAYDERVVNTEGKLEDTVEAVKEILDKRGGA